MIFYGGFDFPKISYAIVIHRIVLTAVITENMAFFNYAEILNSKSLSLVHKVQIWLCQAEKISVLRTETPL